MDRQGFSGRVIWGFLLGGIAASLLALASSDTDFRSFVFDVVSLSAAAGAVCGIIRNDPPRRGLWQLFATGLVLVAAGDVVYDVAVRGFGRADGYPFADVLYLLSYPVLALAIVRLAKSRFDRVTLTDSALVSVALSAVMWQLVITPVFASRAGAIVEQVVTVAYPLMDLALVVVTVYAIFTLPRWNTSASLMFMGLAVMLVADAIFARLVADGSYVDGTVLDVLWPISYLLLAAAVMHPGMRELWAGPTSPVRRERARMLVLVAALFAAPAVVVIDDVGSDSSITLAIITAAAAVAVAWRIMRVVRESNDARREITESESRFRALVQHLADVVVVMDDDGVLRYASPTIHTVFGQPAEQLVGTKLVDLLEPDDVATMQDRFQELREHPDEPVHSEFKIQDRFGARWFEARWASQLDEPAVRGFVGTLRDATLVKRGVAFGVEESSILERILSGGPVDDTLVALVRAIEGFMPVGIGSIRLIDADGQLVPVATPSLPDDFVSAVGPIASANVDRQLRTTTTYVFGDETTHERRITESAFAQSVQAVWTLPIRSPDGTHLLGMLAVYAKLARDPHPHELAVLERARDLAALAIDRDEHARELGRRALHDTLTGLPNRALAQDRLEHALERLDESDADARVAVLFVDLDRFKLVNDGHGHDTGDELLIAVARRLGATVRHQDTIARIGGDEFVVLCEDLHDQATAVELADRVAQAFVEPFALSHTEVTISASVGLAVTDRTSDRAANLLHDADAAMYRAKKRGGARHELFDDAMHTQAVSRVLTERALRRAVERDELRLVYQPAFELLSGRRVAVEALLRWEHPVQGLVAPDGFLRVAEETGIVVPIGEWVLERVCELARSLHAASDDGTIVSANVSVRQLQRPDFANSVRRIVSDAGVEPARLCLEFSETALLDDLDAIGDTLGALKDLGIHLAIDDFGTGGSSLTYLRRFPFEELKIDRMFVEGVGQSPADDAIVAATIDMAHALDMIVTAEGVETADQQERLIDLGCDRAQGYHLGPPAAIATPHLVLVQRQPA